MNNDYNYHCGRGEGRGGKGDGGRQGTLREGPKVRPRRTMGRSQKNGAPKGWGPEGWGAQNFAFFFPSPATMFILSSLSWGSSRGILVAFLNAGALKCSRLEFSGCRVKPRRPQSRRGFTRQPESPNVHISGPRPFHEKTHKRGKKE